MTTGERLCTLSRSPVSTVGGPGAGSAGQIHECKPPNASPGMQAPGVLMKAGLAPAVADLSLPDHPTLSQIKTDSGHAAGIVTRRTSSANVRTYGIDGARCRYADFAHESTATVAVAAHAPVPVIDKGARNSIDVGVRFQGKPGPIGRKRAARSAGAACQAGVCFGGVRQDFEDLGNP